MPSGSYFHCKKVSLPAILSDVFTEATVAIKFVAMPVLHVLLARASKFYKYDTLQGVRIHHKVRPKRSDGNVTWKLVILS